MVCASCVVLPWPRDSWRKPEASSERYERRMYERRIALPPPTSSYLAHRLNFVMTSQIKHWLRKNIDSTVIRSGNGRRCQRLLFNFWGWKVDLSSLTSISVTAAAIHGGDFHCWVSVCCNADSWLKLRRGNVTLLPEDVTERRREPKREDRSLWWVLSSVRVDLNLKRVCHSVWCM